MILYAVLDPNSISTEMFASPEYVKQALVAILGIDENVRVIVDTKDNFMKEIISNVRQLSDKSGGCKFKAYFTELLKRRNYYFVHNPAFDCTGYNYRFISYEFYEHIRDRSIPDTFLTCSKEAHKYNGIPNHLLTDISEYCLSDFEERRRSFFKEGLCLEGRDNKGTKRNLARCVQYGTFLRIFDKQLGMSLVNRKGGPDSKSVARFEKGVEYVLTLWMDNKEVGERSIEIITQTSDSSPMQLALSKKSLKDWFIDPLTRKFPQIKLKIILKERNRIFHARYLQTPHAIFHVERGFDLFDNNGNFKTNVIRVDASSQTRNLLHKCLQLVDIASIQ